MKHISFLQSFCAIWLLCSLSSFAFAKTPLETPKLVWPENGAEKVPTFGYFETTRVSGIDEYEFQFALDPKFSQQITLIWTWSNKVNYEALFPNTIYYWRARSSNGVENSDWTQTWTFTTEKLNEIDPPKLTAPVNNSIDVSMATVLECTEVDSVVKYTFEWSRDSTFTISESASSKTPSRSVFGSLSFNGTYYWRVKVQTRTSASKWSNKWSFTTEKHLNLDPPKLISPAGGSRGVNPGNAIFEWEENENATEYEIQISSTTDFETYIVSLPEVNKLIVTTLAENRYYFWRVRVKMYHRYGMWSDVSGFSTGELSSINGVEGNNVKVFPNPFNDVITVDFDGIINDRAEFSIFTSHGQLIQKGHFDDHGQEIYLNDLHKGVYLLMISRNEEVYRVRIVKE